MRKPRSRLMQNAMPEKKKGTDIAPGTISNLNKKAYEHIEAWQNRPLKEEYPYIYVDGIPARSKRFRC